ncbi:non-specific lipid-transfer protein A-like [Tripterygium wilfordii]|uniref:non-specific lipid-transfer protein A-like n=1 Tax=Tripterygium wilfordii TaxID=458696 RepID=UPI0018F842F6|nr:non-specific lipid-transfer protein A-like [Tripterygium wilfordii]XP_038684113.1 non-specific lipid-transfer protein A-like [Tripterygium wilfordii]
MKGGAVILIVVVAMAHFMVKPGEAVVSCGQVESSLGACMQYLISGNNLTPACCEGVKNLKAITPTTADRQTACNCLKQAAAKFPNIIPDAASSLPQKCGVDTSIPISKNIDCTKVN